MQKCSLSSGYVSRLPTIAFSNAYTLRTPNIIFGALRKRHIPTFDVFLRLLVKLSDVFKLLQFFHKYNFNWMDKTGNLYDFFIEKCNYLINYLNAILTVMYLVVCNKF